MQAHFTLRDNAPEISVGTHFGSKSKNHISLAYSDQSFRHSYIHKPTLPPLFLVLIDTEIETNLSIDQYTLSYSYTFFSTSSGLDFYISPSAGLAEHKERITRRVNLFPPSEGQNVIEETFKEWNWTYSISTGASYALDANWQIYGQVGYSYHDVDSEPVNPEFRGTTISKLEGYTSTLGIRFLF